MSALYQNNLDDLGYLTRVAHGVSTAQGPDVIAISQVLLELTGTQFRFQLALISILQNPVQFIVRLVAQWYPFCPFFGV